MTRGCVLGVDVGTSSTKGVLVAADGTVLHTAVRHHEPRRPRPGHVETDTASWWTEFVEIASELTSAAAGRPIDAVGVSGMGPCVALADAAGTPLRPAILYGVDTRAGTQIDAMNDRYGAQAIFEQTGSSLTSQAAGPKLRWVADHEPEVWAAARRLFMPASYLAFRLTGAYVLDHHAASQCTPMYDPVAQDWKQPWADEIRGSLELPPLLWPADVAGHVTDEAARATGLRAGTPVIAGTIDAWTEAVSVGATEPGDLMLMYGTTMFLIATLPTRAAHPTLWGTVGTTPDRYCLAGGMATSGAVTAWLRTLFGSPDYTDLLDEAADAPPGSRGLLMLPYFAGERTPVDDPRARGVLAGLTLRHTRGDLYRSALEATAFGTRHIVEEIRQTGHPLARAFAVGGGTQGDLWTQIVSDVTGLSQHRRRTTIGASFGAAVLAASSIEDVDLDAWNPVEHVIEPDPGTADTYTARFADYLSLYRETASTVHRLADEQDRGEP